MGSKLIISAVAVAGLGVLAGCSSSSSSSPDAGAGGGSSSSGSSSGSGSGSSSGGSSSGTASGSSSGSGSGSSSGSTGGSLVISDMETGTNGPINFKPPTGLVPGYWFDDVNNVNDTDSIQLPAACTGTTSTTCAGCSNFVFSPLATPRTGSTSKMAAHITCTLSTQYAGCEMDFQFALKEVGDGGVIAYNNCPTTTQVTAVDISQYTGIQFYALQGTADTAYAHEVKFPEKDTDPHGGTCNTPDGGTASCYNHWMAPILFGASPGTWNLNTVHYSADATKSDLNLEIGWGVVPAPAAFDPTTVYGVNFQAKGPQEGPDAGGTTEQVDFWIDDISFITN